MNFVKNVDRLFSNCDGEVILIGSAALDYRLRELGVNPSRTKRIDYDFIISKSAVDSLIQCCEFEGYSASVSEHKWLKENKYVVKFKDGTIAEFDVAQPGTSSYDLLVDRYDKTMFQYVTIPELNGGIFVPVLDILYALKMSHRFRKNSPHFWKTVRDIELMKHIASIPDDMQDWLVKREKETYDYGHPKLNQNKKEFFTDSVPYIFSHDSLHDAVKHLDKPAYQYYGVDGEQVLSSKEKFFQCSKEVRLLGVLEESYVLALERAVIPNNVNPDVAFKIALSKVCTSITSGWFRSWAFDHIYEVLVMYNPNYVDKFKQGLANGVVVPHTKE